MLPPNKSFSPSPVTLVGLDHLRALAISLVFIFHYRLYMHPDWVVEVGRFGWTGVDLFFVLSGYLISSQLFAKIVEGKSINVREFYFKRFLRIIPAYLVLVCLYFLLPAFREFNGLAPLWKYLTFTLNLGLDRRFYATFTHAWSLCIEEQFYLVLPLIIAGSLHFKLGKKAFYLLPILFALGFVVRYFSFQNILAPLVNTDEFTTAWLKWMYYPTQTRLDGLLVGVTVSALFSFFPKIKGWFAARGNGTLVVGVSVLVGAYFLNLERYTLIAAVVGFPLVAIGYGVVVAAAVSPSCFLYSSRSRITYFIATLSYSFYLTHKGIIDVTQNYFTKLGVDGNGNLMLFICLANCLLGAMLLHYCVEKPFLVLRDKILLKRKQQKQRMLDLLPA
jgi:peptidoglycan/LPS O-acetylase OafA/YrhL